ncbi:MAG: acyl-CoA dehydrogenase family protein [Desulfobacterales bacterium]|nr:acyl-CoA dehydrogenase family protein [Desulfobacterales bacterium]
MDFRLNQEQDMLKKAAVDFLKAQCDITVVDGLLESDTGHDKKLWKKMAKLDWMGILIPEEYEGVGWSALEQGVLCEQFGRAAMPSPMFTNVMGSMVLIESRADTLKKKVLPKVASGKKILSFAMDEPGAQYDPCHVSLRAEKNSTGYILNGTKLYVPYAHVSDAVMVVARENGEPGEQEGLIILMVDGKSKGLSLSPLITIANDRQFEMEFDHVAVPETHVVAAGEDAAALLKKVLKISTVLQCAEMVGGAQKELEITAEYLKQRKQFGRPLGAFQAVQHRLADMFIDVQGARWSTYNALWLISENRESDREAAVAKYYTNKAVSRVAFSAQQLHGGMGIDLDYSLHHYYKRAKAFELKLGTLNHHLGHLESILAL